MTTLDAIDRAIVNRLQDGIAVTERPYADAARTLGIDEAELIARLQRMLDQGVLSRFGPLFHADRMGGALTLAALKVPDADFDRVAATVNALPDVAHNYRRDHEYNMWFVIAAASPGRVAEVIDEIERATGLAVLNLPRIDEFHIGLRLEA